MVYTMVGDTRHFQVGSGVPYSTNSLEASIPDLCFSPVITQVVPTVSTVIFHGSAWPRGCTTVEIIMAGGGQGARKLWDVNFFKEATG